jgi:predicted RND superfamily exporter protein
MTKRSAKYVLLFLSLFTVLFGYYSFQVRVDYEFEDFFPSGSEEVAYFNNFRNNFETDNDFIMVAIESPNGVFDSLFLSQIKSLNKDLKKMDYVVEVADLTSLKRVGREPFTGKFIPNKVLRSYKKKSLYIDSVNIYADPMLVPGFVSENGKHLNIVIKHDERLSKKKCDILNQNVDQVLSKYNFIGYHKVGRSVAQSFYIDLMANELLKFLLVGSFLVILFLYLTYRNVWSVIVPLVIVIVSAIWTIGFMSMIGKPLDIMLIVLPTILFIVGISDVIHLYTKFLFLKREGMGKMKAIKKTMNDVGLATLLTSITTAIGFATLYFIGIPIIREFGLIMAFGVLITFFVTFLAFSAFLTLSPERNFSKVIQSDFWKIKLGNAFVFTIRNGKTIMIITLIFIVISLVGLNKIVQKNKLLEDLPENSELLAELEFFDSTIVGLRPFEMGLQIKDPNKSFFDRDILLKIDLLDSFLLENYALKQLISPAMLMKKINFDLHRANPEDFRIPNHVEFDIIVDAANDNRFKESMAIYIDHENGLARITGRIADNGSEYFIEKNESLNRFFIDNKLDEQFEYQITGSASLIDLSNAMLSYNLLLGLFVAFALIALISGLVFKSFKLVLVVLFVNIIPLLGVAGIMGYMGIDLKISTSVIFTIAYGIAVDDSIHFMSKFRIEYRNGKPLLYALKRTYFSTGRAIVLTTFILIGGFISLIFSTFMGTYYIGLLVSSTLLLALIADLYLLPYLVFISLRDKNNSSTND